MVKQDIRAVSVNSNNSSALYSECPNIALQNLAAQNLYVEPLLRVSQTGFILGECLSQQTLKVHKGYVPPQPFHNRSVFGMLHKTVMQHYCQANEQHLNEAAVTLQLEPSWRFWNSAVDQPN